MSGITVRSAHRTLQRLNTLAAQITAENLAAALPSVNFQYLGEYLSDAGEIADKAQPKRHCDKCGISLSRRARADQRYCSHACRQAVYRQRVTPRRQSSLTTDSN
jgi:predicted nucleic acid-binding Zn ribbon protein